MNRAAALILTLAAAVLAPSYYAALQSPATGIYHDDSVYLITSRSLAAGRGYRIESTPVPIPQTKYPILFPALLAGVWKISPEFPANLTLLRLVPFMAALVWFALSYLLVWRQTANPVLAACLTAALAASPQVIFLATAILSETTFAAFATATIYLLLKLNRRSVLLAAVCAAGAYHTRSIGLGLILAGALALPWRDGLRFLALAGALALPWPIWQWLHPVPASQYLSAANYYNDYNVLANFTLVEKITIVARNLLYLPFSLQPLYGIAWGPVLGFLFVPFALRGMRQLARPVLFYVLISLGLIAFWAWPPLRFLVPLLLLLLWMVASGLPARLVPLAYALLGVLTLHGAWASREISQHAAQNGFWIPLNEKVEAWPELLARLRWVERATGQSILVQSNLDPTIYLFTGRHAVRGFEQNASLAWYFDRPLSIGGLASPQVTHVFEIAWPWFLETPALHQWIEGASGQWKLVDSSPSGQYRIFNPTASPVILD